MSAASSSASPRSPVLPSQALPGGSSPTFPPFQVDAPHRWEWRGDKIRWTRRSLAMLGTPETVGNQHVLVGLARIPARQAAPWHQHHGHEEFVYVLEGAGQFWCQGSPPLAVGPGSFNLIPPERWHMHRSTLTEDLVFLWGYAPPGTRLTG